jgi:hypothetical protein
VPSVTALHPLPIPAPADPILAAALDYVARGWYVLPCRVGTKQNARGQTVKDVRLPKDWGGISTLDPATVQGWYGPGGPWHGGSVAVDTGKSGLVVVDLDTSGEKNGFAAWQELGGQVASYVNGTPSGGAHLFFRADPTRPVGTDAHGKLGHGIDVRANGGLVIMPPSVDWRGNPYRETAAADWRNLSPVPDIVVERVPLGGHGAPPPSVPGSHPQRDPSGLSRFVAGDGVPKYVRADADARMRAALANVMATPEGSGFNHALNEAAFEVGHWVAGGYIGRADAESMLSYVVTHVFPHGPNGDDLATIESGLRSGEAKPYAVLPDLPASIVPGADPAVDEAFEQEVSKQYWRLKAAERARERLASEKVTGQGDGRVDWDALDRPPAPVDWQVPDLIAAGRSYSIVGGPKSGKSTTARHLAVRAAEAGVKVLYLDRENTWDGDWVPQLQGMGVGRAISEFLDVRCFPAIPPLDTEAGGEALLAIVRDTGAKIVAIDMLMRFVAGRENDSDTFNAFDRYVGQQLKAMGVSLLRLDHSGKDSELGARGSSAKSGDVDVQWILTRRDAQVTLDPKGITRKADQRGSVTLMVRDGRLLPVDATLEPRVDVSPNEEVQRLLGKMLDEGAITLKTSGRTVLTKLREMGRGVPDRDWFGPVGQWTQFKAKHGDGAAADVLDQSNRTKGFQPTFLVENDGQGSSREAVPSEPLTSSDTVGQNGHKGPLPGASQDPGSASQDQGSSGSTSEKSALGQGKDRFPRSRKQGKQ